MKNKQLFLLWAILSAAIGAVNAQVPAGLTITPSVPQATYQSVPNTASATSSSFPMALALIDQLRKGGYVIYIHHAMTLADREDKTEGSMWWKNCATTKPLAPAGLLQTAMIGSALRNIRIPIAAVRSSEYCRAIDTANALQLGQVQTRADLNAAPAQRTIGLKDTDIAKLIQAQFRGTTDSNLVLIGHALPPAASFEPVLNVLREGETAVFKIEGDRNHLVVRLSPVQWRTISQAEDARAANANKVTATVQATNSAGPLPGTAGPLPNSAGPLPITAGPLPITVGPLPNTAGPLPGAANTPAATVSAPPAIVNPQLAPVANNSALIDPTKELKGTALVNALRKGGYVLYMRHATATVGGDASVLTIPNWWDDCSVQRNLSDIGKEQTLKIGASIRDLKIPVSDVRVGQFCRTRETGHLLGLGAITITEDLNHSIGQRAGFDINLARFKHIIEVPPKGSNLFLISHTHGTAKREEIVLGQIQEGEVVVYYPDGKGGTELLARIPVAEWDNLRKLSDAPKS